MKHYIFTHRTFLSFTALKIIFRGNDQIHCLIFYINNKLKLIFQHSIKSGDKNHKYFIASNKFDNTLAINFSSFCIQYPNKRYLIGTHNIFYRYVHLITKIPIIHFGSTPKIKKE